MFARRNVAGRGHPWWQSPSARRLVVALPRALASPRRSFAILLVMLVAGNLLVFRDYVFGGRCLLFEDLGADSVYHNLPVMHYLSSVQPLGEHWIPGSALGNNVFMFPWVNPFNPVLRALGWHTTTVEFAHRIVYYAIVQSLLAGAFFYWFVLRSGASTIAAIASSCGFALCGAFTAISTWMVMVAAPLLAGLAIVLWAYKAWQQDGRWYFFSLAVAYYAVSTQPIVTLYQLAVFCALYLLYDAAAGSAEPSWVGVRSFVRNASKTALVGSVGVLSFAFFLLPHAYYVMFQTARPYDSSTPLLSSPPGKEVLATFLRLYSNDLVGTANVWTARLSPGPYPRDNYFELPFLYGGLLSLLVVPAVHAVHAYRRHSRRELLAAALLLVPLALAHVSPGLRAWLFFGGRTAYFRWTSMFAVAAMAIVTSRALRSFLSAGRAPAPSRMSLTGVALVLVGALSLAYLTIAVGAGVQLEPLSCGLVVATIVGYTVLLHVRRPTVRWSGVLILLLSELAYQGHHTVSHQRRSLAKTNTDGEPHTSGVYSRRSVMESVGLVKQLESGRFFRLVKRPEYLDIVDNSSLCQDFLGTRGYTTFSNAATVGFLDERRVPNQNAYLPGFGNRFLLDALVGVKYYFKRGRMPIPPWAVPLTTIDDTKIFRNPRALPLGVLYDRYMFATEFRALTLTEEDKDLLQLSVAILPDGARTYRPPGWERLAHVAGSGGSRIDDGTVQAIVEEKQRNALRLVSLRNDVVVGRIFVDQPRILFYSIPYDEGWQIRVDGASAEKLRVHTGFLGVFLQQGVHEVALTYRAPYFRLGLGVSCLVLLGFLLTLFFFRRKAAELLSIAPGRPPGSTVGLSGQERSW